MSGGPGNDACLSTWDSSGGDLIDGGGGHDVYFADAGDTVYSGEETFPLFRRMTAD